MLTGVISRFFVVWLTGILCFQHIIVADVEKKVFLFALGPIKHCLHFGCDSLVVEFTFNGFVIKSVLPLDDIRSVHGSILLWLGTRNETTGSDGIISSQGEDP